MTPSVLRRSSRFWILILTAFSLQSTGCTAFKLPPLPFGPATPTEYAALEGEPELQPSASEQIYYSVRQAHSQNGVVLQVEGDSLPVRVMPLPSDGRSVFVSTLLEQTGAQRKLGSIEATLFRHSPEAIGGLPLRVKMSSDGRTVRPESDYALHPGDRVRVKKAVAPILNGMLNAVMGR